MLPTRVLFKRSVWKGANSYSCGPHIVPYDSLVPRPSSLSPSLLVVLFSTTPQPTNTFSLAIPNVEAGKSTPPIRTQARAATILPSFIGLKFQVYNGKVYHDVTITEDMVGHKLGEFSPYVP
ncbi:mitochondrial ribosomal protein S19 [Sporothrix schenckii 1099-18]|uniref:Mitochondrial ribosomal protein S19 n=1 Tax=Sporothrix schenckii 1099-18 TaxID=1397361 RepID=A0A0F2LYU7_SPOSC|nr:mitochondrial ribosomal protein S19 [Sporothrix schenckii 1099-18]KJR82004.1 mitochondrial ribosomal protein S19 [Sporothrix schenckii 1099-18]